MVSPRTLRAMDAWNRKLHNYVGLFLLTFIWLFSLSGILLNHSTWAFAQSWPSRVESSTEIDIQIPPDGTELSRARHLMHQAEISGEINRIAPHTDEANSGIDVQVLKPGRNTEIKANFETRKAVVKQIQTNAWGVVQWLHTFTGVRMNNPEMERDWVVTRLWSLSIDAVCLGMIFLVASSLCMCYPQVRKRNLGWGFLGGGTVTCLFFIYGLSWIY